MRLPLPIAALLEAIGSELARYTAPPAEIAPASVQIHSTSPVRRRTAG
jgi:hypothetical protein